MTRTFPDRYRDGLDRVLAAVRDIQDHQRSSLANRDAVAREARHPFDDHILATGVSLRDVVRATIQTTWN